MRGLIWLSLVLIDIWRDIRDDVRDWLIGEQLIFGGTIRSRKLPIGNEELASDITDDDGVEGLEWNRLVILLYNVPKLLSIL